jgi:hypothetical protein
VIGHPLVLHQEYYWVKQGMYPIEREVRRSWVIDMEICRMVLMKWLKTNYKNKSHGLDTVRVIAEVSTEVAEEI